MAKTISIEDFDKRVIGGKEWIRFQDLKILFDMEQMKDNDFKKTYLRNKPTPYITNTTIGRNIFCEVSSIEKYWSGNTRAVFSV